MKRDKIPLEVFKTYPKIVDDYLSYNSNIQAYAPPAFSLRAIELSAQKRPFSDNKRTVLSASLEKQYVQAGIEIPSVTKAQIEKLKQPNTFTITTGHQLCMFTGPLYFVIKALQTIKLCDDLNNSDAKSHYVPVFWMASEDHDFEEINHIHLFGKRISWEAEGEGMVGDYTMSTFGPVFENLSQILGESEKALELKEVFRKAYLESKNLAQATRKLIHGLFGERGLIVVDGNERALKNEFKDILKEEVSNAVLENKVSETIQELSANYKIQVNPRPVNIFYLQENKRHLIELSEGGFSLKDGDKTWTKEVLLAEVDEFPERFSPNVILRPLYQEVILPNLCYIGGPSEIAYWLELKSSFDAFKVPFPVLNLRNSFMWLDRAKLKKLDKYGLNPLDLFLDESDLNKKLTDFESIEEALQADFDGIKLGFESLSANVSQIDPSLKPFVLAEGTKMQKQLEYIKAKLLKAKKSKNEEMLNAFWNLHEKVFPGGNLHERYDNFVSYFLTYGWSFFDHIYEAIDPVDSRLILITES